ncbi:MAG: aspartate carbamoyltransferase [Candidatus Eremiobacteraeota bacterium]|nr:aspartate carbamoyltransferase [Candidatus Eremiobacteraeota bacterium]
MKNRFASALLAAVVSTTSTGAMAADTTRQAQVEHNSEKVMPFSMQSSQHVFVPNPTGGVQTVLVPGGNRKQIRLVRSHLQKEAAAFARGDFTDPASIHGGDMPGIRRMHAGSNHIKVRYAEVLNGASITYTTIDPELVSALHAWFKAQVNDHGAHAAMKM